MARRTRAREIAWYDLVTLPPHLDHGSSGEIMLLKAIKLFGRGLPMPKREVQFAKTIGKRYRADAVYPEAMLILEIDGGQWMKRQNADGQQMVGGGHNRDTDRWRNNAAALLGYRVLHFSPEMIRDHPERVVQDIQNALAVTVQGSLY
jgi:very-short-patch-repair endonuclease